MLRLLEHYTSPQGEGPKVGVMSQFVRFAGCNLKCPGWPCDSPQAIDPKIFEKEQTLVSAYDLSIKIATMSKETGARNIVFTGGEPLIQNQDELAVLVDVMQNYFEFEIFTNGTRPISRELIEMCRFVMDWKMPGSGEDPLNPQRLENIKQLNGSSSSVKFVVGNFGDLDLARRLYIEHMSSSDLEVFVGVVWNKFNNEAVIDYVRKHQLPWRLNVQVHNYLFGAHRRYI
jgi:7-carboxy-7-deazaguanine synthase